MRRVLVVVFGIFASMVLVTPSAFADSPHFISASAKVNASGDLVAIASRGVQWRWRQPDG